jgi:transcriptional regulator of nitric oxide reductase
MRVGVGGSPAPMPHKASPDRNLRYRTSRRSERDQSAASGATVTVLVMGDSIVRSATKLIRSGRLGTPADAVASAAPQATKSIDPGKSEIRDWQSLVGDGSVRRLILTVADVNKAFEKSGYAAGAAHPEEGDPDDTFIDLYVADVAVPTIGRSLLGDDGYDRPAGRLKAGSAGADRRRIGAIFVQGRRLRPRRHLRPHRIDPGYQQHPLPRPRPHPAGKPRSRRCA